MRRETYQQCNICGSTDINKQSGAMGVHTCNSCGSGASISWKEREILGRRLPEPPDGQSYTALNGGVLIIMLIAISAGLLIGGLLIGDLPYCN